MVLLTLILQGNHLARSASYARNLWAWYRMQLHSGLSGHPEDDWFICLPAIRQIFRGQDQSRSWSHLPFWLMQVDYLLLLVIIPGLAKRREIYFQPSYDLGDHWCEGLAHEMEVMKVLHSIFLLESLEKGCDDAMELQGIDSIVLVLGWSHANIW
jgi:hypothetical protein